jgi:CheY-like chemotaxis protein
MKNILIIEDEILIQQSLKKLFERKGLIVDVSASGKVAIDYILKNSYDRIICDLMLQDISGFDVIEESKKKFSPDEISKKFVIMTAYNSPQVLSRANSYQGRNPTECYSSVMLRYLNRPLACLVDEEKYLGDE